MAQAIRGILLGASAERSLRTFRPAQVDLMLRSSIQPSSRSRDVKAETHTSAVAGDPASRKPTVGSLAICCEHAASGHIPASPVLRRRSLLSLGRGLLTGLIGLMLAAANLLMPVRMRLKSHRSVLRISRITRPS